MLEQAAGEGRPVRVLSHHSLHGPCEASAPQHPSVRLKLRSRVSHKPQSTEISVEGTRPEELAACNTVTLPSLPGPVGRWADVGATVSAGLEVVSSCDS